MKLDVLAFGAHPDDVELSCAGTILQLVRSGRKVGVVDLTRGELGTRGTLNYGIRKPGKPPEFWVSVVARTWVCGMVFSKMIRNINCKSSG